MPRRTTEFASRRLREARILHDCQEAIRMTAAELDRTLERLTDEIVGQHAIRTR